jgi:hypothetical protein
MMSRVTALRASWVLAIQGWYSVYDCDTTTVKVIAEFAAKFNTLSLLGK